MAINPKFVLKNANTDKQTSIKFYFYLDKQRFTYSLGPDKKIFPELWDKDTMRPHSKPSNKLLSKYKKLNPSINIDLQNLTMRMDNVVSETLRYLSNAEIQSLQIRFDELKSHLDTSFNVSPKASSSPLSDSLELYIDNFIKDIQTGKRLITTRSGEGRRYRKGTIKAYKVLLSKIIEYRDNNRNKYLKFDDIDIDFYNEFQQYIYSKNFTPNYFGNFIKNIKSIMRTSMDEGYHKNTAFMLKAFKKTTNDSVSIYLTEKEVQKLYEYDFGKESKYIKYRDVFLIGCWTAQRFGDYSRIDRRYIKERDGLTFLDYNQEKTTNKVIIPLRPEVIQILNKYDFKLPKFSGQKMNDALKEIGKKLKFNEEIEVRKIKGGIEITTIVPKYTLIASHTARRTGCTLMYLNDIPLQDIMKISGHKSEAQLLKYIKVTKEETAKRLATNSFFSGQKLKVV